MMIRKCVECDYVETRVEGEGIVPIRCEECSNQAEERLRERASVIDSHVRAREEADE